jgi:hypothetical protein
VEVDWVAVSILAAATVLIGIGGVCTFFGIGITHPKNEPEPLPPIGTITLHAFSHGCSPIVPQSGSGTPLPESGVPVVSK